MAASKENCVCSGIRKCLMCEDTGRLKKISQHALKEEHAITIQRYNFCTFCGRTYFKDQDCLHHDHKVIDHEEDKMGLKGVSVIPDFVNEDEERTIVTEIDKTIWKASQSGRRKQDFGPQVNFKKRKLKQENFTGLPQFSKVLVERMWSMVPALSDFQPVELCNLEYVPARGSSIDPHFDDFWVWGDRLVTLNLLSQSTLTFSDSGYNTEVSVPMPRRSLIIVRGPARYKWKHAIKREDIISRRIAITLRELAPEFCEGGENQSVGSELIKRALSFQGKSIQVSMKVLKDHEC